MADNGGQQPVTILVKKADGTFERKTLEEINALKKQAPKTVSADALAALQAAVEDDAAPTAKPSKVEPVAQPMNSPAKDSQAEEIIKKITFTVSSTALNRLRTLIQLRLKDIRTPDQVHEALLRTEEDGGVGLTDEQAEEIVKQLPGWLPATVPAKTVMVAPAPGPAPAPASVVAPAPVIPKPQPAPAVPPKPLAPPVAPAATPAPKPAPVAPTISPMNKEKAINTFIKNSPDEPYYKIAPDSGKTMMRDITTTRPMAMGPIDEIRAITLTDFRRLSNTPEEGAMRLKQKFMNLKDESVLLYMEALEAWKKSPLYAEYVLAVITSLATKQPLSANKDAKMISPTEMKAIVSMEQQLVYV